MADDRTAAYDGVMLYRLVWRLIRDHDFDIRDFVIVGSARLWLQGVIPRLADIDIVARNRTWDRALELSGACFLHNGVYRGENTGAPVAQLYGRRIDVCPSWIGPDGDADGLIERAEELCGLPHMSMDDLLAYKRELRRPKDRRDLARILQSTGTPCEPAARPVSVLDGAVAIRRLKPVAGALG